MRVSDAVLRAPGAGHDDEHTRRDMSEQQPFQYGASGYEPEQTPPAYGHGYGQQPQPYYPPTQYGPVPRVAPKNPGLALLVSFFVPGVGTMMNGEVGKGVGILVGYIVSVFLTIILIGILGMLGFWIWGMVDAYNGANEWNRRHGIVS
jgi:TM2 domain-containing membrane protein YozV